MEILDGEKKLPEEMEREIFGKELARHEVVKKFAVLSILKDHVQVRRTFEDVDQAKDVGMVDHPHQHNFALDFLLKPRTMSKGRLAHNLDRNLFTGVPMTRQLDLACVSLPKVTNKVVRPNRLATNRSSASP
jgi:uncharacterized protein (DUF2461 family)